MRKIKEQNHAKGQAKAQLRSIVDMVSELERHDSGSVIEETRNARDEAETRIHEDALSVEVRSDWHEPGKTEDSAEYTILLCTGGPACRIIGDLNDCQEPGNARIEYQDWGTPWTDYPLSSEEEEVVLTYARQFYYGG